VAPDDLRSAPANQRSVRRHNLGVVLRHVADRGPRSRAAIAQDTGLNKTTVSSLVGELIAIGLLRETEIEQRGTVGRPALPVELAGARVAGLGLEIGVDYLAVRAADLTGAARHSAHAAVDNRGRAVGEVFEHLGELARGALDELAAAGVVTAGGVVGVPGLVDSDGRLLVAPNLGWTGVAVPELLAEELGSGPLPLRAENEANLGAMAELWEGAARGLSDFVYVSGELGVGAGIVIGGELYRGSRGFGGELGHVCIDADGDLCACGSRGCVETRVALDNLLERAGLDRGAGAAALAERAEAGDERALAALDTAGHWLGVALADTFNLLDPRGVVIGGYLGRLADWLVPGIEDEIAGRVLAAKWGDATIVASALGAEAAVRGACALALRRVYSDPAIVVALAIP
jgi:predicted NBD/HSP70 family sugar kinase